MFICPYSWSNTLLNSLMDANEFWDFSFWLLGQAWSLDLYDLWIRLPLVLLGDSFHGREISHVNALVATYWILSSGHLQTSAVLLLCVSLFFKYASMYMSVLECVCLYPLHCTYSSGIVFFYTAERCLAKVLLQQRKVD